MLFLLAQQAVRSSRDFSPVSCGRIRTRARRNRFVSEPKHPSASRMTQPSNTPPASVKRLMFDYKKLQDQAIAGVNARPDGKNIYRWDAVLFGPEKTPYEDGTFHLTLEFPPTYPMSPPVVRFEPAVFHPNVYTNGAVCLDILNKAWSPTLDVSTILVSIQALLSSPNPNSPANAEAANLYQTNRAEYEKRVKQLIELSWVKKPQRDSQDPSENPPKDDEK